MVLHIYLHELPEKFISRCQRRSKSWALYKSGPWISKWGSGSTKVCYGGAKATKMRRSFRVFSAMSSGNAHGDDSS